MNSRSKSIGIVMALTLLSKVFGFARDVILAYFFGATSVSDAYLVSLTIPEFVFSLVIQAIAVGFIPIFIQIVHDEGEDKAHLFTSQVLSILYILGVITVVCLNVFPEVFVSLFASGFDEATVRLTAKFVQVTSIAILFKGTVSVLSAFCQANGEFTKPALIGLPLDIVVIASIIIANVTDTMALAYGTVCAYASQVFLLMPYCMEKKYKYRFLVHRDDKHIKKMIALFLPVLIGVGANQINILVDRTLASSIAVGGISALNYANKVDNIMENVMVASIAGVMYPFFSSFAAKKEYKQLAESVESTLEEVCVIIIPISVITVIFAKPIVALLFGRGAFNEAAISLTSSAMIGYSVGMLGVSFRAVLTRVYYSIQNVSATVVNSVISITINIVLNLLLAPAWGVAGLALASSISSITCAVLLLLGLNKRIGYKMKLLGVPLIKVFVASGIMGVACYFGFALCVNFVGEAIALLINAAIGIAVYFGIAVAFRIPGIQSTVAVFSKVIQQIRR